MNLGGESPLQAVVVGTVSRRQGRCREAGSEGSRRQNPDSTNRNRIEGRRGRVTRQWTGMPDNHSDARVGKSGEGRGKESCLTLGDLQFCRDDPGYRGSDASG